MNEDGNIVQGNENHNPDNKKCNVITSEYNGKQYKKEEDYLKLSAVLTNGFQEHDHDGLVDTCGTSKNNDTPSNSKCSIGQENCQEKHGSSEKSSIEMITLGSNNSMFMTLKTSYNEPIYTSKELPQFLQDSLVESLSRITITEDSRERTVEFIDYKNEEHLPDLTALITKDLSEPYSIYTYRYFLHNWPQLSFLAYCRDCCVGAIVCKLDQHRRNVWRGYIAMLVVHKDFRRYKIGSKLVQKAIRRMVEQGCDEVVLETEVTNRAALNLYGNLGFVRDKRLLRYYLNGVDAWRLKLWLV